MLKSKYGIEFFARNEWLTEVSHLFVINNVNLIKSANTEFLDRVEQIVFSGVRGGVRHEKIAQQLFSQTKNELGRNSPFRNAMTRASVIARDQVNKFNGELTMLRQTNAGVKKYIWRTTGDERVRPLHRSYNGRTFSWKTGTAQGLHPGRDIMCRCYAEPIL